MEIRTATIQDVESIQNLSIQLGHGYPIEKTKRNLNYILNDEEQRVLLAVAPNSNDIIGYIHMQKYRTLYSDDFLNILGIIVDEGWRNKGFGRALLDKAEIIATELGCEGLRAASSSMRHNAHAFYHRNGFDMVKDQKRFIKMLHE